MITIDALTLPDDLLWADEFAFEEVAQEQTRTEGGALIVEETALTGGRPITLRGASDAGWFTRTQLLALQALAANANTAHTLTLHDSRSFQVQFARPAIEAEPIVNYSDPAGGDFYAVTLKLIEI